MFLTIFFIALMFIFGAAVGSFTSVVIYRLHTEKKGIFRGKSACPSCDTKLRPLDLIPIISFLVLRGKCRYCSKEISYMYPLLEIFSGAVFAMLFWKFPFFDANLHFSGVLAGLYLLYAFYSFVLIFTFFYDLHYFQVADEIMLPAILIAFIATLAAPLTPHFFDALLGALLATAFFAIQFLMSKGTWIGLGDLRVGAFMGAVLGWKLTIVALFSSYMVGSISSIAIALHKKKLMGVRIPFAPFLAVGTFIAIFFGQDMIGWYLKDILGI